MKKVNWELKDLKQILAMYLIRKEEVINLEILAHAILDAGFTRPPKPKETLTFTNYPFHSKLIKFESTLEPSDLINEATDMFKEAVSQFMKSIGQDSNEFDLWPQDLKNFYLKMYSCLQIILSHFPLPVKAVELNKITELNILEEIKDFRTMAPKYRTDNELAKRIYIRINETHGKDHIVDANKMVEPKICRRCEGYGTVSVACFPMSFTKPCPKCKRDGKNGAKKMHRNPVKTHKRRRRDNP